jgi:hypothetical protein
MPDPSSAPGSSPSDLDRLRAAHPLWAVGAAWVSRASGPDARQIVARRGDVEVRAWTVGELSAKIAAEETANGWLGDVATD